MTPDINILPDDEIMLVLLANLLIDKGMKTDEIYQKVISKPRGTKEDQDLLNKVWKKLIDLNYIPCQN